MLNLNEAQMKFLRRMQSRIIKELDAFANWDSLCYKDDTNVFADLSIEARENAEKLTEYRKGFLINSFSYTTGIVFFLHNELPDGIESLAHAPEAPKGEPPYSRRERAELGYEKFEEKYLDYCRNYGKIFGI